MKFVSHFTNHELFYVLLYIGCKKSTNNNKIKIKLYKLYVNLDSLIDINLDLLID